MSDSSRIAVILAGLIVPLLALGIALGSTVLLIPVIALALVAFFVAGRAIGRYGRDPKVRR